MSEAQADSLNVWPLRAISSEQCESAASRSEWDALLEAAPSDATWRSSGHEPEGSQQITFSEAH